MLISIIPLIVLLVGLLTYALASNPKVQEIGRIAIFVGLFFTVMVCAHQTLRLG